MGKSPIRVVMRLRPTSDPFSGIRTAGSAITVDVPKKQVPGPDNTTTTHTFQLDGVLQNAPQDAVYNDVTSPLVANTLQGFNSSVLCYGQTGAGKTYSMSGNPSNYRQRGMIPRAIAEIFQEVDAATDRFVTVSLSCIEIYNDQMYDLLADDPKVADHLNCLEDSAGNVEIKGLSKKRVRSEEEALSFFFMAEAARATAAHSHNSNSSRSHFIFTIHLDVRKSADKSERAILSKLNLVDLAGSERTKKTGSNGQVMKEAMFINRSLSFLEQYDMHPDGLSATVKAGKIMQTVNALARHETHIPYRQCRLTSVLKDALGGNSKTVMIANVWPEEAHLEETISTLRFAERMRMLKTDVRQHESNDPDLLLRRYERQIRELKQELTMRDTLSGRARVTYGDLSDAEIRDLNALMKSFLEGSRDVNGVPLDTVKVIKEAFMQCRMLYQALAVAGAGAAAADAALAAETAAAAAVSGEAETDAAAVGVEETGNTFAVGRAPPGACPETIGSMHGRSQRGAQASVRGLESPDAGAGGPGSYNAAEPSLIGAWATGGASQGADRKRAFEHYKATVAAGMDTSASLKGLQASCKDKTLEMNELADKVNSLNKGIAKLTAIVEDRRSSVPAGQQDVTDSEEYMYAAQLKAQKAEYRHVHSKYQAAKLEVSRLTASIKEARTALLTGFEEWFSVEAPFFREDMKDMDPEEQYHKLERDRLVAQDPTMLAFEAAKKQMRGRDTRVREFGGDKAKGVHARKMEAAYAINFGTAQG